MQWGFMSWLNIPLLVVVKGNVQKMTVALMGAGGAEVAVDDGNRKARI